MLSVGCYNSVMFLSTNRVLIGIHLKVVGTSISLSLSRNALLILFRSSYKITLLSTGITRESNCLRIPQLRTEAAKRAFFYIMVL